jgi:L-threonylcarbamoyladenylate synthase
MSESPLQIHGPYVARCSSSNSLSDVVTEMSIDFSLIKKACDLLNDGELVALPTETVYGLGADATSLSALHKLYALKGRPQKHPVIVHLHSLEQVNEWAVNLPANFFVLAERFWPGPLTMIVQKAPAVHEAVTGGQNTVGLRMPSHPLAIALLKEFNRGIAAPSANKFGRISPTTARAVKEEFGSALKMVLDGGPCDVGIESTIVDLSSSQPNGLANSQIEGFKPKILRPGMILAEDIYAALSGQPIASVPSLQEHLEVSQAGHLSSESPRVPGALPSHYAPRTRMDLVPSSLFQQALQRALCDQSVAVLTFSQWKVEGLHVDDLIVVDKDPETYARSIYNNLRKLDSLNKDLLLVEEPPQTSEWSGIYDRLLRASS